MDKIYSSHVGVIMDNACRVNKQLFRTIELLKSGYEVIVFIATVALTENVFRFVSTIKFWMPSLGNAL